MLPKKKSACYPKGRRKIHKNARLMRRARVWQLAPGFVSGAASRLTAGLFQRDARLVALDGRCADALDVAQLLGGLERAMGLAPRDDGIGATDTDTLQRLGQFGGAGLVDVDHRLRLDGRLLAGSLHCRHRQGTYCENGSEYHCLDQFHATPPCVWGAQSMPTAHGIANVR